MTACATPDQWVLDVCYLAKLADWAAGEGFCHLKGMDDPDEWCFAKWEELRPESNGDDYSADALAAALIETIQAATRITTLETALRQIADGADDWQIIALKALGVWEQGTGL